MYLIFYFCDCLYSSDLIIFRVIMLAVLNEKKHICLYVNILFSFISHLSKRYNKFIFLKITICLKAVVEGMQGCAPCKFFSSTNRFVSVKFTGINKTVTMLM